MELSLILLAFPSEAPHLYLQFQKCSQSAAIHLLYVSFNNIYSWIMLVNYFICHGNMLFNSGRDRKYDFTTLIKLRENNYSLEVILQFPWFISDCTSTHTCYCFQEYRATLLNRQLVSPPTEKTPANARDTEERHSIRKGVLTYNTIAHNLRKWWHLIQ
jgi:hypothetical protein